MSRAKRILLIVLAFLPLLGLVTTLGGGHSSALSGSQFQAGDIIDDAIFYDSSALSTSGVQSFLNSKLPSCDTNGTASKSYYYNSSTKEVNTNGSYVTTSRAVYGQRYATFWNSHTKDSEGRTRSANYVENESVAPYPCLKDYKQNTPAMGAISGICGNLTAKSNRTAAQIITDVGAACGINPKVLVVLLQKEQGLVTDGWPWKEEYTHATGFACTDSAPCDPSYSGYFYQVYYAAKQYRSYRANPGNYNYVAGQNNQIPYSPTSSCGKKTVYITNQATAGLYDYTPYTPDSAALNNLTGTGDKCSSYGNRNFWVYYNEWFGSTLLKDSFHFERLAGNSPSVLNTASAALGGSTQTVVKGKDIYVFYYDASNECLRYALWDGVAWSNHLLDGTGATTPGKTTDDVGQNLTTIIWNKGIQVYYYDATYGNLRHAWQTSSGTWHTETMDGSSASLGEHNSNLGQSSAVTIWKGQLQLYYYDATSGNLRHAWWPGDGRWHFETMDGTSGSLGKLNADLGSSAAVLVWNNQLQLYYYDATSGNLRHAWWPGDGRWHFETMDGTSGSRGGLNANVGQDPALIIYNNQLQLYYYDSTSGNLRHAWWPGDGRWHFETMDGTSGSVIGNNDNVGQKTVLKQFQKDLYIFYYDSSSQSWRAAYWDNGWFGFNLDGGSDAVSGSPAAVGGQLSAAIYQSNSLEIFYQDSGGGLGHAWANR